MKTNFISIFLKFILICFIPVFITIIMNGEMGKIVKEDTVVTVLFDGETIQLPLEEYVVGVVAAEMPVSYELEALKAQAICARTFTLKHLEKDDHIVFSENIQSYVNNDMLKERWGTKQFVENYLKIEKAVKDTKGNVITYNNELINSVFHAVSAGYTMDAKDLWGYEFPYLKVCNSQYDISSKDYSNNYQFDIKELFVLLNIDYSEALEKEFIHSIKREENGYVKNLVAFGEVFTGDEFRKKINLASTNFNINKEGEQVHIETKGYGHGVGLSQYGSNQLAKDGQSCEDIIKHYYNGVNIISNE